MAERRLRVSSDIDAGERAEPGTATNSPAASAGRRRGLTAVEIIVVVIIIKRGPIGSGFADQHHV
jgi:hypothetical protein